MWYVALRINRLFCSCFLYVNLEVEVIYDVCALVNLFFYVVESVKSHSMYVLYDRRVLIPLTLPKALFVLLPLSLLSPAVMPHCMDLVFTGATGNMF